MEKQLVAPELRQHLHYRSIDIIWQHRLLILRDIIVSLCDKAEISGRILLNPKNAVCDDDALPPEIDDVPLPQLIQLRFRMKAPDQNDIPGLYPGLHAPCQYRGRVDGKDSDTEPVKRGEQDQRYDIGRRKAVPPGRHPSILLPFLLFFDIKSIKDRKAQPDRRLRKPGEAGKDGEKSLKERYGRRIEEGGRKPSVQREDREQKALGKARQHMLRDLNENFLLLRKL